MNDRASKRLFAAALLSLLAAGCAGGPNAAPVVGGAPLPGAAASAGAAASNRVSSQTHRRSISDGKIQHVIFIVQDNRSFNNLFMGYPGATTQTYGYDMGGNKIPLHSQQLATTWDIDHSANAFFAAYDGGKNDGWQNEYVSGAHPTNAVYAYVRKDEIKPYWAMAKSYVLADEMFTSNLDGSFVSHQYTIAGFAGHSVNFPNGYWGCPGGATSKVPTLRADRSYGPSISACFNNKTIGDLADAAGLTWNFYSGVYSGDGGLWQAYQAIKRIYNGNDWKKSITPPSRVLSDISSGTLANITWVMPTYENSDHAGFNSSTGPAWVSSIVNAVGQSQFWSSSAIFIMWDDWGGWYDSVLPVYEDYDGLGYRVPLLMVSPYAKKNYVTHTQYETSSVLRFIEDNWGLSQLAASDARANDPANDAFNFSQKPRKFKKVKGSLPPAYWSQLESEHAGPMKVPAQILNGD